MNTPSTSGPPVDEGHNKSASSEQTCGDRRLSVNSNRSETPLVSNESTSLLHNRRAVENPLHSESLSHSTNMPAKNWASQLSPGVYILVMLFAISSWIDINGLWVEVPLLVNELPEGWNLPSFLVVIIQIANIGPIIYTIANRAAPHKIKEWPVVYIIISIGASSCFLLAFFWDRTTYIGGVSHSTALISLTALLAIVDCTSSVVYLPYMALFKPQYMTAFYVGEGLSGLLPGVVGLIQGGSNPSCMNQTVNNFNETALENITRWQVIPVYDEPRFSVCGFFLFMFGMICVSGISFTVLHLLPSVKSEHVNSSMPTNADKYDRPLQNETDKLTDYGTRTETTGVELKPEHVNSEALSPMVSTQNITISSDSLDTNPRHVLTTTQFVFILLITAWVNALNNGILPSTQSYSTLPYGNLAYTLSVRLAAVANPLMCLVALFVTTRSLIAVGFLTFSGTILAIYQLYLAALSPDPPYKGETIGIVLVIVTQILLTGCLSYTKVINAIILNEHGGQKALLWCGGVTQIGSFLGAVVTFIIVSVLQLLQAEPACSNL